VESGGNQDQATDQEELNPQDDAIGPQASKDDPPPGLPTPAQSPVVPIAAPPATPIAAPTAPTAPATPPGPQSSNYNQLLWLREQQPQQPQQPQQLHTHTPPKLAVPSIEQRPRQRLGYSKEVAIITKIYTNFCTNRIFINKLVTTCQGVPTCHIAVSNPLEDLSQLISKLQPFIIAWEKEHPSQRAYTTFTDRYYCNQD